MQSASKQLYVIMRRVLVVCVCVLGVTACSYAERHVNPIGFKNLTAQRVEGHLVMGIKVEIGK